MMRARFIRLLAILAIAAGGGAGSVSPVPPAGAAEQEETTPVKLPRAVVEVPAGQGASRRIRVEVAATDATRARGLMFRRSLADDAGMLFLWRAPRRVAFWMKNTYLPLDMVFIDADGRVVRVHEGARPGDLTPIPSGQPVLAVLEVKAGMARRLGLRPGVRLKLPRGANTPPHALQGVERKDR